MESDFLANLGWREGLMILVGVLAIYIAFAYLRMRRLRRNEPPVSPAPLSFSASSAMAAYGADQGGKSSEEPVVTQVVEEKPDLGTPEFQFPWNEPPAPDSEFQRVAILEVDVEQLRKEVGALRAELLVLKEAIQRAHEPAPEVRPPSVADLIAPQYSEAMQLAQKQVDPAEISQQCGISRAEAELVAALARNQNP